MDHQKDILDPVVGEDDDWTSEDEGSEEDEPKEEDISDDEGEDEEF